MAPIKPHKLPARTFVNVKMVKIAMIILITLTFTITFRLDLQNIQHKYLYSTNKLKGEAKLTPQVSISIPKSWIEAYNTTHLWLMPFADQTYFNIARTIPCRVVQYSGGPTIDKIDSCDRSPSNEFSLENTLHAQQWIFEHQHPSNCNNKKFAIIGNYAKSGLGSTIHQVVWAFATALAEDRIAVYRRPGKWMYGSCSSSNLDCFFLPITNCSISPHIDNTRTVRVNANIGHWNKPVHPPIFQNRTFNWYRAQLLFYLMRYKPETMARVQQKIAENFQTSSLGVHRPYVAVYVRRSDKVTSREMSQSYSLKQYFDLFDADARRVNITKVYLNSEDVNVFREFNDMNKEKHDYYKLLSTDATRGVVFRKLTGMSMGEREKIMYEFLTDLYIEANADLHVGTLTSNWCRLVDEIRLVLGKIIPYYTPENKYLTDN